MWKNLQRCRPSRTTSATSRRSLPTIFAALILVSLFVSFCGTRLSIQIMTPSERNPMEEGNPSFMSKDGNNNSLYNYLSNSSHLLERQQSSERLDTNDVHPATNIDLKKHPMEKDNIQSEIASDDQFAACLLIKDDNDILNEWIAYHYHVINLRHIVVATDPSSLTSPAALLDKWRQAPFQMRIDIWNDTHYMPDYFLRGEYDKVPSFIPTFIKENVTASIWHVDVAPPVVAGSEQDNKAAKDPEQQLHASPSAETYNYSWTIEQIEADLVTINNHRFRQVTFVSRCFHMLKRAGRKWVAHIDTDEYMVINPRLRQRPGAVKDMGPLQTKAHAGSLVQFLKAMFRYYPKRLLPSCIMMPTILFGATENFNATLLDLIPKGWNRQRFESLRWTYHADWADIANGLQKAIVDVSTLPDHHPIFVNQMIKSVHQPLDDSYPSNGGGAPIVKETCRKMTLKPNVDSVRLYPLTTNHYVGSLERYTARQDLRRNLKIYYEKASVNASVDEDGWIQSWLASFVERHGLAASRHVLGDYYQPN